MSSKTIPSWIQAIFALEYSPKNEQELQAVIEKWVEDTGKYRGFDDFFQDLVSKTRHENLGKSGKPVFSIRNYSKGDYINCNGLAVIGAVKGVLDFNKKFEVIIDYQGGSNSTGQMDEFKSHVSLADGRKNYGGRAGYRSHEKLPQKSLTLLYMLSDAFLLWHSGRKDQARNITADVEKQMKKEGIRSEYIEKRIHESRSNINF